MVKEEKESAIVLWSLILIAVIPFGLLFYFSISDNQEEEIIFKVINETSEDILRIITNYSVGGLTLVKPLNYHKITVDCNGVLLMYELNETLSDYTGITIYAANYCYDLKQGNLNLTYEDEKWKSLNSCWEFDDLKIGACNSKNTKEDSK